ncbi:lipopolysaccharide biosynthesis protein [Olivibacter domesticus]|uniref:Membrane protein involved in the export of O-antigen and teichoic acid n=1 Tax=Olivibacter domesticus TaxID=407022 RepID=A0A1H7YYE0_OLID1|nr:lipopolysaccharide biosynthesis protein [Olivibacter domesticus]SEM50931.1 Membrane protein involved in the export of O-antigen and teichoic acid [Olivibacter domesticus]
MDNSKSLILKGVFWNGLQLVVNQSFTFIVRLILAKLLLPEQFGIIGMATVFTGFVQVLTELGIGAALVQRKDDQLNPIHYHTSFWTGVIWSALLFLLMTFVAAPFAADFYNEPILKILIPVISIGILLSPINLVNKAQLTKQMNFKKIARIENITNIIAGIISIVMALLGAGVWSLAFNSTAIILFAIPLYFKATGWFPKLIWSKEAFKDVFGFGIYTTGTNVINYFINNVDYLLIGKVLSAQALGAYTFAFVLTDTFRGKLMSVINNVMYPLYGKKQGDPEALKKYYLKVVSYNSIIIYPIMVLLLTLAEPIILNIFGEKWHDSIIPLKILSVSVMIHMLVNSNTALIRGLGKPGLEMKLQLFKAFIFIPTLIFGIYTNGIIGASWAILINKIIAVIIAQYTFNKLINIKISSKEFFSEIKAPWIASILAYSLGYFLYVTLNVHYIITGVAIMIIYCLTIFVSIGKELTLQIKELKRIRQ